MNNTTKFIVIIGIITLSNSALGQFSTDGITATGTAETKKPAEIMRMSITIQAKGANLQDAMKSLAEKKKSATIKLEKLEVIEDSIQFGDVSTGATGDSAVMIRRMRQMMGDDPRIAKMMKTKPPITVSIDLTADWNLEASEDSDQLIITCDQLKQKITETDIGGAKDEEELSEEQAELAEEMAEMMSSYSDREETPADTPNFHYVRRVSADSHNQLLSQAFASARKDAERLAKATQFELGKVKSLASRGDQYDAYSDYYDPYGGRSRRPPNKTLEDGTIEAVGTSPNSIIYSLSLGVVYEIK